jgi:methylglyoxal synthase
VLNIAAADSEDEKAEIHEDEYTIRRLAVEFNIPVITTLELASAIIKAFKYHKAGEVVIRSLNEYMDNLAFKYW